jgi:hypothetical protein
MNWKGYGRKQSWPNLRYYPEICLEGLRETMKTSLRTANLWAEVRTRVTNTKQKYSALDHVVWDYSRPNKLKSYLSLNKEEIKLAIV